MIVCQYLLKVFMSRDQANHELVHDLNSLELNGSDNSYCNNYLPKWR